MRQNLFALAAFAAMLPLGVAQGQPVVQSQEGIALENQILQLQNQVQQLQSGNGGGGSSLGGASSAPPPSASSGAAPDSSIVANLLNQVQQLQAQVQQLNGQVDTLQNQVDTQHAATEKEIGDLNFKLNPNGAPAAPGAPGTAPAGAPATLAPPPGAPAPAPSQANAAPDLSGSPEKILHAGNAAFAKGDNAAAEAAARSILANNASSPQAYQAQYLLAKALYAEGKPQDAAIAFDDAYNRNRTGAVAPQSLLGLANSLAAINQNEAACDTLSSLNSQFPSPPAGMAPRIEAASHRAHCS
jgi:TolA-binding protein